jgi:hypothetical protein
MVQLWIVKQRATEAGESTLLRFVTRKRLVVILQMNSHCGELYHLKTTESRLRTLSVELFVVRKSAIV